MEKLPKCDRALTLTVHVLEPIAMLHSNNALLLAVPSQMTVFNQSECIISVQQILDTQNFVNQFDSWTTKREKENKRIECLSPSNLFSLYMTQERQLKISTIISIHHPVYKYYLPNVVPNRQMAIPRVQSSSRCYKTFFWRKSRRSRFPPKLKQQEWAILKVIHSFEVQFCLKQH